MYTRSLRMVTALLLCFFTFIVTVNNSFAAEIISGEDVQILQPAQNLYISGQNVRVIAPVQKDLVAAGGEVTILSEVERSIIAAGGRVTITSPYIGATVRVAGGTVKLSGVFNEDVIVAGGEVIIDNAEINGDLIVGAGTVRMQNSNVKGRFIGGYEEVQGDIDEQVTGAVMAKQSATKNIVRKEKTILERINLPWELSMIAALCVAGYFLHSRKRLHAESIRFDAQFGLDVLLGMSLLIMPIVVLIASFITLLFPIIAPIVLIMYLCLPLVFLTLPIYVANFLKNTFKLGIPVWVLMIIVYISMFVIFLFPVLTVFRLIIFIFGMAAFGFAVRMDIRHWNLYFQARTPKKVK